MKMNLSLNMYYNPVHATFTSLSYFAIPAYAWSFQYRLLFFFKSIAAYFKSSQNNVKAQSDFNEWLYAVILTPLFCSTTLSCRSLLWKVKHMLLLWDEMELNRDLWDAALPIFLTDRYNAWYVSLNFRFRREYIKGFRAELRYPRISREVSTSGGEWR